MNKQCVLILGQIEYGHVKQLTIMGICLKIRKPHILSTSGWLYIYIHSNFPTAPPPFPVVTLPGASCKAWGLGRPKPEGRKTMGFCHGMFHRIVMDLYNRFCWCDFFGTSRDFMGYHGIYIYIYIHFAWYAWGYFGGYSWKNMCLKHHQLGIEWDLMDVCRLVICYMAMA